jgi:membrane protein YdbS with pleckstrin-like domain
MSAFVAAVTAWFFSSSIASASLGGAVFSSFFLTMLALTPLVAFLLRGWKIKKEDVFSSFTNRA